MIQADQVVLIGQAKLDIIQDEVCREFGEFVVFEMQPEVRFAFAALNVLIHTDAVGNGGEIDVVDIDVESARPSLRVQRVTEEFAFDVGANVDRCVDARTDQLGLETHAPSDQVLVQEEIGVLDAKRLRIGLRQVEVFELTVVDFDVLLRFKDVNERAIGVAVTFIIASVGRVDHEAGDIELGLAQSCDFEVGIGDHQTRKRRCELKERLPRQRRFDVRQR